MAINTSLDLEVPDDMDDTGVSQMYKGRFGLKVWFTLIFLILHQTAKLPCTKEGDKEQTRKLKLS